MQPNTTRSAADVGPATPALSWCLAGYTVLSWTRNCPADDPHADLWIEAEGRIVDGRVMRSAPRIYLFESRRDWLTGEQARELIPVLTEATDIITTAEQLTAK